MDSGIGVVERTFEYMAASDWGSFGALLSSGVERVGPFGERVIGRDAYIELMSAGEHAGSDEGRPSWDVHCVAYTADRRSAFARVTAHVPRSDRDLWIEEALVYELDESGLISRIEVFWRDPRGPNRNS
jgi:hypothetical protein